MATTLEVKIVSAAAGNTTLQALLGTAPMRLFESQEYKGAVFPSATYQLISSPNVYVMTGRMPTLESRVQFTIMDTDPERGRSVEAALLAFFATFNAMLPAGAAVPPVYPNRVVNRRSGGNPQTQPVTYWRTLDVMIWNNESL